VPANALDFDDEFVTDSQLLVVQNHFFNRRLVTTLGLRYDQLSTWGPRKLLDADTLAFRLASAADRPFFAASGTDWFDESSQRGWRRSLGAVYHVTNQLSLTANFSNGIELPDRNRTVLPTEQVPEPYRGETVDVGISFSLFNDKLVGSVKAFETKFLGEQANGQVTTAFVQPNNDIMSSFDFYFRQAGVTTFGAGDPIRSVDELRSVYFSQAAAYLSDRRSKGQELELTANPTPNWAIRLGYSRTESTKVNVLNEAVPWWTERVALWQALDRTYTTRTGRPSVFQQPYVNAASVVQTRTVAQRLADSDAELAAGHTHMMRAQARHMGQNVVQGPPFSAGEGVGRIAVLAAQRTAGKSHEHRRETHGVAFALERAENLGDLEPRRGLARVHTAMLTVRAQASCRGYWRGSVVRRSAAIRAGSVPGNLATTCCRLVRPTWVLPCSSCVYASFSSASGALRESGHVVSTRWKAAAA
jgi:hypothetical protein